MKGTVTRQYLTAISIVGGIITLIEPDGSIGYYRQRGLSSVAPSDIPKLIRMNLLNSKWATFKELPKHYTISFEDEAIMGRAFATFKIRPIK